MGYVHQPGCTVIVVEDDAAIAHLIAWLLGRISAIAQALGQMHKH